MKFFIEFNSQGEHRGVSPVTDGSFPLFTTTAALEWLRKQLTDSGNLCKNCGIVARKEELENGNCKQTTGCAIDADMERLEKLTGPERLVAMFDMVESSSQILAQSLLDIKPNEPKPMDAPPHTLPDSPPDASVA
jgi:hypothetical protein